MEDDPCEDSRKLADPMDIYVFAAVWSQMYKNHEYTPGDYFLNSELVGRGMEKLGFTIHCIQYFAKKYPNYIFNGDKKEWDEILRTIDIVMLGDTIYAEWRYYQHWHEAAMYDKDYQWFVKSFRRLAELAVDMMSPEDKKFLHRII